ncbi:hypothetical protein F4554_001473 [Actinopolymorpha rutila]|uniref:Glutaredoxin n=2 Tax=Actinopolymorpha rutila TaxID=446787 RepID=A0A852Z9F2_9ACTN|nr:hypothetical protein [Actinopolymorpha rutila]NYH88835.1 hypothetical protein [Actinopolymorpha rutila]
MAYVIYGTACEYGIPLDAVLAEVHRSNMSKLGPDGRPILRADGKVVKGPGFSAPEIAPILRGGQADSSAEELSGGSVPVEPADRGGRG